MLWNAKQTAAALGISERHLWKLAGSGRAPRPVRLGKSTRWKVSEIEQFVSLGCDMRAFEAVTTGTARGARS